MKSSETKFLVKKAQRHDKDAFTELMQLYMKDMYRTAIAILMNEEDAAIHHYWGRGMTGNLQASDTKQQELTENGIATVYREEPGFDMVDVYQGDDPEEDGSIISYYTDSSGDMEYIIQAGIVDLNDSLLGKTIHVNFKDLGFFSKGKFTPAVEGNWNFRMILPDVSSAKVRTVFLEYRELY